MFQRIRVALCLTAFIVLQLGAISHDTVYIYAGAGTAKRSLKQTETTLRSLLNDNYEVSYIFPEQLIADYWETQTALLVIPAGADIPYAQALDGAGNQKIRSFVEQGGAYLGLCAGGYYAGAFVDFAKGTALEVQGERELAFFPGTVRGPFLAPYDYASESSARAAQIFWQDALEFEKNTLFTLYYNGGGYFVDAQTKDQVTVLASYDSEGLYPAIIECQVGSGIAILSGVHFEHDPNLLDADDPYLQQIIPTLSQENSKRLKLVQHLLKRLGLQLKN